MELTDETLSFFRGRTYNIERLNLLLLHCQITLRIHGIAEIFIEKS